MLQIERKKVFRTALTSQRSKRKFGNGRRRTENTEGSQVEKANIEPGNGAGQDDDDGDGQDDADGHDGHFGHDGHSGHVWDQTDRKSNDCDTLITLKIFYND